eukprot:6182786-Pleurochrysis_carterae.AAC.2
MPRKHTLTPNDCQAQEAGISFRTTASRASSKCCFSPVAARIITAAAAWHRFSSQLWLWLLPRSRTRAFASMLKSIRSWMRQ